MTESVVIPETLPVTERAICFNGGLKDGCGAWVDFVDGKGLCPRCGVHQRYVKADPEYIEYVTGRRNVYSFAAKGGR